MADPQHVQDDVNVVNGSQMSADTAGEDEDCSESFHQHVADEDKDDDKDDDDDDETWI